MSGFVITLREGIEAALIIGLVLAAVGKAGVVGMVKSVWLGVAAAVLVSAVAGAALVATVGYLPDEAAAVFEGVASLVAVGVLTFMIFWMRTRGSRLAQEVDEKVSAAAGLGSGMALGLLAFAAVAREGLETVLFMAAAYSSAGVLTTTVGALAGLGVAVALGFALYRGSLKLNIRTVFQATGAVIVVLSAGMLAYGLHELQELGVVPTIMEHLWDTNSVLDEKVGVGAFLKALLGYNGNPSLIEVVAYWTYLTVVGWLFIRPKQSNVTRQATRPSGGRCALGADRAGARGGCGVPRAAGRAGGCGAWGTGPAGPRRSVGRDEAHVPALVGQTRSFHLVLHEVGQFCGIVQHAVLVVAVLDLQHHAAILDDHVVHRFERHHVGGIARHADQDRVGRELNVAVVPQHAFLGRTGLDPRLLQV